jgi:hypothetical protein
VESAPYAELLPSMTLALSSPGSCYALREMELSTSRLCLGSEDDD